MSTKELPVLQFGSFRRYPTKKTEQEFRDDVEVCNRCVSGVCCVNQDAIALTSFDIFRLAAFFDMSPARFMLLFTQDKFGEGDDETFRRHWISKPDSSVVTWLRRRANSPSSPCIFLKYIRDVDGTPRRVCGVHDARPLSCREYYFAHCKTRGTGELAALLAEGFEKVRDGEITEEMVDAQLERFGEHDFGTSGLTQNTEYGFWVEMKCALNMHQANHDGSNSYSISDYQDPIDEKVNRVLSTKYLRSEESYGLRPRDEQLMPYSSGLSFAGSLEYKRILGIAQESPSTDLFRRTNYPYYVNIRTAMPGVKHSDFFATIPASRINEFLKSLPDVSLFTQHPRIEVRSIALRDVCAAVLRAYNYLIQFASHVATLEPILESEPPGTFELELFKMAVDTETSFHSFLSKNEHLNAVKRHAAARAIAMIEQEAAAATTDSDVFYCFKCISVFHETILKLPPSLKRRVTQISRDLESRLQKNKLGLYLDVVNPINARRLAGKRLDSNSALSAWSAWYGTALDVHFASRAGFKRLGVSAFYERAVNELEKLPFRRGYAACLFDVIKYLALSMSANHRRSYNKMPFKNAADRLASYSMQLFDWQKTQSQPINDSGALADFLIAQKDLGRGYAEETLGSITREILDRQLADGSWNSNLPGHEMPDDQAEFLEQMCGPTWTCMNALRVTKNDLVNPANARLRRSFI